MIFKISMSTEKSSNHKRNVILYILLIGLISFTFAFGNYKGVAHGSPQYLPIIYSLQDESYLTNDFYVQETKDFNIRFFFSQMVIFVNKVFDNFDVTFPFILSITIFLISLNIYLLANFYFKDKKFSILASVMSIFLIHFNLGGLMLIWPYLSPNIVSNVFILSALNLIIRRKHILGYFTLGLAVVFQPIAGLLMYGTFIFVHIAPDITRLNIKRVIKTIFKSLSFFISALINLIPLYILSTQTALPEKNELISYMISVFRHWTHFSPSLWPLQRYIYFGVFLIIVLILSRRFIKHHNHKIYLHSYLIITGFLLLIGTIFVEVFPLAVIAKSQTSRILVFFSTVSYLLVIRYVYLSVLKSKSLIKKIIIMIIPIFFFSPVTIPAGLLSLSAWMIFERYNYKFNIFKKLHNLFKNRNYNLLYLLSLGIILPIIVWLWLVRSPFSQLGLSSFIFRLLILIYIVAVYLSLFIYLLNKKTNKWLILVVPILLILMAMIINTRDISDETGCGQLYVPAQYIKDNTDKSSLFLIPPDWTHFRHCANRALVVDLVTVFTDQSVVKWHNRLLDVTKQKEFTGPHNKLQLKTQYHTSSDTDIRLLQSKYKFDYAIFEKSFLKQKHDLPIFYQDDNIIIFSVHS